MTKSEQIAAEERAALMESILSLQDKLITARDEAHRLSLALREKEQELANDREYMDQLTERLVAQTDELAAALNENAALKAANSHLEMHYKATLAIFKKLEGEQLDAAIDAAIADAEEPK